MAIIGTDKHMPVFETIIPGLMALNPFHITPKLPSYGLPIGITEDGHFYFNPQAWQALGLISSTGVVIMGEKDHGKTALAKDITYLSRGLHISPNDPHSQLIRTWVDDTKAHEWSALADYYNCEPFIMRKARLNPLDERMELGDQEFIVRRMIEQATGDQVSPAGQSTLSSALETMKENHVKPSLHTLVQTLVDPEAMLPALLYPGSKQRLPISEEQLRSDALDLAVRTSNMLRGPYGQVFGFDTDQTVFQALSQQMISADYSGANDDIVRIMQMLFWIWKRAMSESGSELMVHNNIYDETYGLLRHIEFTRPLHDTIKRLRESASTVILITHAPRDYKSIPGEAGQLAYSVLEDMPVWFVGKMTENDSFDVQQHFNCSEAVRKAITRLPRGCFMAFIGSLEPFVFRMILTPKAQQYTFSNQALATRVGAGVS